MSIKKKHQLEWYIKEADNVFWIGGDIDQSCVDDFCTVLGNIGKEKTINMFALEIDEGACLAVVISALRRIAPCTLIEAPKMLAHTLYKINNKRIAIHDPRSY